MAKATPISAPAEVLQDPAPAAELFPEPVIKEVPIVVADDLKAIVAEAEAEGKVAVVAGNFVRVDN